MNIKQEESLLSELEGWEGKPINIHQSVRVDCLDSEGSLPLDLKFAVANVDKLFNFLKNEINSGSNFFDCIFDRFDEVDELYLENAIENYGEENLLKDKGLKLLGCEFFRVGSGFEN